MTDDETAGPADTDAPGPDTDPMVEVTTHYDDRESGHGRPLTMRKSVAWQWDDLQWR